MHFGGLVTLKTVLDIFGCEKGYLCLEQTISFMFGAQKVFYTSLIFVSQYHIYVLTTIHPYLFILWIPTRLKQSNFRHISNMTEIWLF